MKRALYQEPLVGGISQRIESRLRHLGKPDQHSFFGDRIAFEMAGEMAGRA